MPLNIIDLPNFQRDANFSLPQDRVLVEDSQTQALFTGTLASGWELRNSLAFQRTQRPVFRHRRRLREPGREPRLPRAARLPSHPAAGPEPDGSRRPRSSGFGTHNLLFGYEFHRDKYRTEVTAGDDPDCICGYWYLTIAPMDITHDARDAAGAARHRHRRANDVRQRSDAGVLRAGPDRHRAAGQGQPRLPARRLQARRRLGSAASRSRRSTASRPPTRTARASSMRRATTSSSTSRRRARSRRSTRCPRTGRSSSRARRATTRSGHRWQGWNGRVDTTAAVYYLVRNNVTDPAVGHQLHPGRRAELEGPRRGRQHRSRRRRVSGLQLRPGDAQVRGPGHSLDGKTPRFAPKHNVNLWLRKDFAWRAQRRLRAPLPGRAVRQQREHAAPRRLHDLLGRRRLSHASGGSGR